MFSHFTFSGAVQETDWASWEDVGKEIRFHFEDMPELKIYVEGKSYYD